MYLSLLKVIFITLLLICYIEHLGFAEFLWYILGNSK